MKAYTVARAMTTFMRFWLAALRGCQTGILKGFERSRLMTASGTSAPTIFACLAVLEKFEPSAADQSRIDLAIHFHPRNLDCLNISPTTF